jgi:hypothetical protein
MRYLAKVAVLGMVKNVPSFWEMSLGFVIKLE